MLKYYLKISFKEILRKKFYSLVVVIGFSIGLTTWLLVMGWMDLSTKELGLDKNSGKMFRIGVNDVESSWTWRDSNQVIHSRLFPETPFPLADMFRKYDSNSVEVARFGYFDDKIVKSNDFIDVEKRFAFSDVDFLKFYNFPILSGDISEFFSNPKSVIINKRTADKYFPEQDAVGKYLNINDEYDLKVIAVIKNLPKFYKIQFELLSPIDPITVNKFRENWTDNNVNTVIRIKDNADMQPMYRRMNDTLQHKRANSQVYYMYPFVQYNNYSDIRAESGLGSNIQFMYIFSAIALYIIFIACINYFNISISTFANRAKEIAIRKSFGAGKGNIIIQFLLEGQILSFISLCVAILTYSTILPYFNSIFASELQLNIFSDNLLFLKIIGMTIAIGFISSAYSAFYYSVISPARIFSSSMRSGSRNINFIRIISYIQFTISIAFMVAAFKVDKQLEHLKYTKEGFDESYSIEMPISTEILENYNNFETDLKTNPDINSVSNPVLNLPNIDKNTSSDNIIVNIKPLRIAATLDFMKGIWEKYEPDTPFEYLIQDADLHKDFTRETTMSKLFNLFTLALIIVTSLGFVCFSSFITEQRKSEIAVRKVYGASSINIYFLLLKDFLIIGLLSIITAHIFVFFTSITWLNKFSSKIGEFGMSEYIIPSSVAIVVLIITVSYHAILASVKSPASVLRGE